MCDSWNSGSRPCKDSPMYTTMREDIRVHRTERRKESCLLHTRPMVQMTVDMLQRKVVDKMKTYFTFNNIFSPENRDVYAIACKNIVQPDWPQMTIQ